MKFHYHCHFKTVPYWNLKIKIAALPNNLDWPVVMSGALLACIWCTCFVSRPSSCKQTGRFIVCISISENILSNDQWML